MKCYDTVEWFLISEKSVFLLKYWEKCCWIFNTESYSFKHLNNKTNDNKEAKDKNKILLNIQYKNYLKNYKIAAPFGKLAVIQMDYE